MFDIRRTCREVYDNARRALYCEATTVSLPEEKAMLERHDCGDCEDPKCKVGTRISRNCARRRDATRTGETSADALTVRDRFACRNPGNVSQDYWTRCSAGSAWTAAWTPPCSRADTRWPASTAPGVASGARFAGRTSTTVERSIFPSS